MLRMCLSRLKKLHKMVDTFFKRSEHEFDSKDQVYVWYVSIRKYALEFPGKTFFLQLPSSQKYIYTWSILKFLDVLKSYESETFISGVLDPAEQDCDTSWYPFFRRVLGNL